MGPSQRRPAGRPALAAKLVVRTAARCAAGPGSGALNTTTEGITTLADCAAKVKSCSNANYISFSLAPDHQDCSWYAKCDMSRLAKPPPSGRDYQSFQVRFE